MASTIAVLLGVAYSVMNLFNVQLSELYGNYMATVIIHAVGLVCILPFLFVNRKKGTCKSPWLYTGGALGVVTVIACNLSIQYTGVTVTLVLSLLGQFAASMIIDHFGLLGFQKYRINSKKTISVALIVAGAVVMMLW